jgi:hypothetical protein
MMLAVHLQKNRSNTGGATPKKTFSRKRRSKIDIVMNARALEMKHTGFQNAFEVHGHLRIPKIESI